jgi:hypothetical protein
LGFTGILAIYADSFGHPSLLSLIPRGVFVGIHVAPGWWSGGVNDVDSRSFAATLLIFETADWLLISVVIMVLLRPTNRLQAFLAEHGCKVYHPHMALSNYAVIEAEYRTDEDTPSDVNAFRSIQSCLDYYGSGDELSIKRVVNGGQVTAPDIPKGKLHRADILWVSPTEFVSTKLFGQLNLDDVYKLVVSLKGGGGRLELYSYSILEFNEAGQLLMGPPPVTPPQFLSHVLAPILDQVASIMLFSHRGTPTIDSALSLVPTTGHNLTQDIKICFSKPQSGLLPALATFPVHPNVCLSFERVPDNQAERAQVQELLRDLKERRRARDNALK